MKEIKIVIYLHLTRTSLGSGVMVSAMMRENGTRRLASNLRSSAATKDSMSPATLDTSSRVDVV